MGEEEAVFELEKSEKETDKGGEGVRGKYAHSEC